MALCNPLNWVLSLEPPVDATPEQLARSADLKSKTPDFEDIFRNKTGLSSLDIEGANKLYAPGSADIRAGFIDKTQWCSETNFNAGKCSVLRRLSVKSVVANLGPWNSGKVTITHTLNPKYNLTDFDMSTLNTDAGNCQLKQVSQCRCGNPVPITNATTLSSKLNELFNCQIDKGSYLGGEITCAWKHSIDGHCRVRPLRKHLHEAPTFQRLCCNEMW